MPSSLVFWSLGAVLLFWIVGAYNRLMRLRADANAAFAALDAELARQVDLVRKQLPGPEQTQPASLDGEGSFWAGLHGAAAQFAASLAAARSRPRRRSWRWHGNVRNETTRTTWPGRACRTP
jgi:LemA protein